MAETIHNIQIEQLEPFRECLGETTFQRVQRDVWHRFSAKAPPIDSNGHFTPLALVGVWDELIHALEQAVNWQTRERESGSSAMSPSGPLWETVTAGVNWAATVTFRRDERVWEVVVMRNGHRSSTRRFLTREKADAWADQQRIEVSTRLEGLAGMAFAAEPTSEETNAAPPCPRCKSVDTEALDMSRRKLFYLYRCLQCAHVWRVRAKPAEPRDTQR